MATPSTRRSLPAVGADIKFKAALRLRNTRHGEKMAEADRLAEECGRKRRSVLGWQTVYMRRGAAGLLHTRSDKGVPRVYADKEFELVIQAAGRLRRWDSIAREFRKLQSQGLPGCKETFRVWVRRLNKYGYEEAVSA